ncbi:MAG: metallophosphoesterase family protein [Planctomycetes bacterium]|nr:metallophosphoesterase family protein [Planctomycetota bacterium]
MKYVIFSDIHANLEAFDAVLEKFKAERADRYICLGDLVGYGADPTRCIEKVNALDPVLVAGNHDFAAAGILNSDFFNSYAYQAIEWTKSQLSDEHKQFLGRLKLVRHIDGITLVHSNLYLPELFEYMQSSYDVQLGFTKLETPLCFIGHSHVPVFFVMSRGTFSFSTEPYMQMVLDSRVIVNVGSVGQPRDDNPLASYAVYDETEGVIWIKRIEYDVDKAAGKIRQAGLSEILSERLKYGR